MTTKRQVLTPLAVGQAVELAGSGGLWRKQILPIRKIRYKGRDIDFNKPYLTELANSFKRRAFDQVPVQIATEANKHNNDPRNTGGELVDVQLANDGLYGYFRPNEDGAKVLAKNPKIGVSARILEGYRRSDGATFGGAMQHVLLTVDPHVTGMKPWEQVQELSADEVPEDTIDLSAVTEEDEMPPKTKAAVTAATTGDDGEEVTLSREEYTAFQELLAERAAVLEFAGELTDEDVADEEDDEDADEDDNSGDGTGEVQLPEQVRLTMAAQSAQILELTNQARTREVDHAVSLLAKEGLAPAIIEAARPLLGLSDQTIELSNGEDLDVGSAVAGLLDTVVGLARSGDAFVQYDVELGRTDGDPEEERRADMLKAWEAAAGE